MMAGSFEKNLKEWGWERRPARHGYPEGSRVGGRHVDFDSAGNLVVGFVTRKGSVRLDTSESPALFWHVQAFDPEGQPAWQRETPTRSWYDNEVFTGDLGTQLLRMHNDLKLLSGSGELRFERPLPEGRGHWNILAPPSGRFFVVAGHRGIREIVVLSATDLKEVATCSVGDHRVLNSVSDRAGLFHYSDQTLVRRVEVGELCGPVLFASPETANEPEPLALLDDSRVVSVGVTVKGPHGSAKPTVALQAAGVERWRDSFDPTHENVSHVRVGGNGSVFAVLVQTYAGGSRALDRNGHRTKARVVLYRSEDGKRLMEVPIVPLPPERLDAVLDFAISRDGRYLGILSDGTLRCLPVDGEALLHGSR